MSERPTYSTDSTTRWLREIASSVDYSRFRRIWLQPATERAEQGYMAACYEQLAQRAISEGEYYLAHDAAINGLRCAAATDFPLHRLVSLKVTALARSGATGMARRVMEQFLEDHEPDSSVCSAQARLFRDMALADAEPGNRRTLFKEAARWASQAKEYAQVEGKDWAYPANQEAQFQFLAGERAAAETRAIEVIEFVSKRSDAGSMWNQTNLAEMHLVRGDLVKAGCHYRKAAELGEGAPGDLASNRAVAAVLLGGLGGLEGNEQVESWFPKPILLVFAGYIPDSPDRATKRLPRALCRPDGEVARALKERILDLKAIEGICASAPGGDILFAEALVATGARLSLVNPFLRPRILKFAEESGEDWPERLEKVFQLAVHSESIACAEDADRITQCEYCNLVMLGGAMLRARRINASLQALVLWDESDDESPKRGGTGQFVDLCRASGVPVEVMNPRTLFP